MALVRSTVEPLNDASPAEDIFEGLRDSRTLTRDRALATFRRGIAAGRLVPEGVETLLLDALGREAWEAKHGGLLAAIEVVKAWDRPPFRASLLKEVPRLLQDGEVRVRQAVAGLLLECSRRDGLAVYDELSAFVLGDVRGNFRRAAAEEEERKLREGAAGAEPPKFLPDTEGWRTLETSMGALEAMMQGCSSGFTPRIGGELLTLLEDCCGHTNRFVREYAHLALKSVFESCDPDVFLAAVGPRTVVLVSRGIRDDWSQVRYAASVAARAFMQKAGDGRGRFYPELLGPMCLNRHCFAEGIRRFSQETWRFVCGPQGGARLLVLHFDTVLDAYFEAATSPDHAVREAACHCLSELAALVAGTPGAPTPHRVHFNHERVQRMVEVLINCFEDESWAVRDVASTGLGHFVRAFPLDCEPHRRRLLDLWFDQMADNIPCLRKNGAAALAMALQVWAEQLWPVVTARLAKTLPEVLMQPEQSTALTDGADQFSVTKPKPVALEDRFEVAAAVAGAPQDMYSRGLLGKKAAVPKRRIVATDNCMSCAETRPQQLWEASEGMIHLLTELSAFASARAPGAPAWRNRLEDLAAMLSALVRAFGCSTYRHHHLLKQRACERLPALSEALGPQLLQPQLAELLKIAAACAGQESHPALREAARRAIVSWRQSLPPSDFEAAVAAADVKDLAGG